MSKRTLSTLEYDINAESKSSANVSDELAILKKNIYNAMNDKVGSNAEYSIEGIKRHFEYHVVGGLKTAIDAVGLMRKGYADIDKLNMEAETLAANARSITDALGEL